MTNIDWLGHSDFDLNFVLVEISDLLAGRRVQPRLDRLSGAPHVGVGIENSYTVAHGLGPSLVRGAPSQPRRLMVPRLPSARSNRPITTRHKCKFTL